MNQVPPLKISSVKISPLKIAFIKAGWHADILQVGYQAFTSHVHDLTQGRGQVGLFEVPGGFEIPLLAKQLALSGNYDAIVGSAFVVDGGLYRHEFVAAAVVTGLMQVQLDVGVPVLSMVLTPQQPFTGADEQQAFFLRHFEVKGREAAEACIAVLDTHRALGQVA